MVQPTNAEVLRDSACAMADEADLPETPPEVRGACIISSTLMLCTAALLEKLDDVTEDLSHA